jgi:hypothetical protein
VSRPSTPPAPATPLRAASSPNGCARRPVRGPAPTPMRRPRSRARTRGGGSHPAPRGRGGGAADVCRPSVTPITELATPVAQLSSHTSR